MINSRLTVVCCVEVLLYEVSWPEVYESDSVCYEIDQDVLRLDVSEGGQLDFSLLTDTDLWMTPCFWQLMTMLTSCLK